MKYFIIIIMFLITNNLHSEVIGGWRNWKSNKSKIINVESQKNKLFLLETIELSKGYPKREDKQNLLMLTINNPERPKLIASAPLPFKSNGLKICGNKAVTWSHKDLAVLQFEKTKKNKYEIRLIQSSKSNKANMQLQSRQLINVFKQLKIKDILRVACNKNFLAMQTEVHLTVFRISQNKIQKIKSIPLTSFALTLNKNQLISLPQIKNNSYLQVYQLPNLKLKSQIKIVDLCCPNRMPIINNIVYFYDAEMTRLAAFDLNAGSKIKMLFKKSINDYSQLLQYKNKIIYFKYDFQKSKHIISELDIRNPTSIKSGKQITEASLNQYFSDATIIDNYIYVASRELGLVIVKLY